VARILFNNQKQRWFDEFRQLAKENKLLGRVIRGDQSRCFQNDPETKREIMKWKKTST
jgi:hypothetical protein